MTRWLMAAVAACILSAGCDDESARPSNLPQVFSATLSPAEEVPPVTNAEAGGRGAMQMTIERSGAGSAGTATIYFSLSGFPAGTTLVGAHVHSAGAGVVGPIVISTGILASSGVTLADGSVEYTARGIPVDATLADAIAANPGAFYFNVHSPLNPGGFARGQLSRVQ